MSKKTSTPFLVGLLLIIPAILPDEAITMDIPPSEALFASIFLTVVIRIIALATIWHYCTKYLLANKIVWMVFGGLFAGWVLIALNIVLWSKEDDQKDGTEHEKEVREKGGA